MSIISILFQIQVKLHKNKDGHISNMSQDNVPCVLWLVVEVELRPQRQDDSFHFSWFNHRSFSFIYIVPDQNHDSYLNVI